ncbi:MAG: MBL fold metallo-hydrolase [bacterium]|nr:MBL fold metallo-hydrolase [bacterium]
MLEVTFIGTGDAFGSGGRRHTAILLRDGNRTLLLDCGPTTLLGLRELGIDPREIDAIVLSHYHGDHIGGVPFMLLDFEFADERTKPLQVIGPKGVRERIARIGDAMCFEGERKRPYELSFEEYRAGVSLEIEGFRLIPMPAHHQPVTEPHMLRVESEHRSVCFSGDTGWHEELPEKVGDVDLFISECVNFDPNYEFHLSHRELDLARERFRCSSMVLTHLGQEMLENMDRVRFDIAHDGLILKV